jgi:CRISPR-associated protein Csh1
MIHEIAEFIDYLEEKSPDIFSENLKLKEGLYVFLEKEGDELVIKEILNLPKKNQEQNELYYRFLKIYNNTEMLSANKSYLGKPGTFNEVGSPFGIRFKKEAILSKGDEKLLSDLKLYFTNAEKYIDKKNADHINSLNEFKKFCFSLKLHIEQKKEISEYENNKNIYIFYSKPAIDDFKTAYDNYLKQKVFLKAGEKEYGVSSDLNFGNEDKKLFVYHRTASFDTNYKVDGNTAINLYKFFRLKQKNDVLPNPMPIFVDKNELDLSGQAITFYNTHKDKKIGHKEIIEKLLEKRENLQNFYLLYFSFIKKEKKHKIVDLDFVPVFKYKFDKEMIIQTLFQTKNESIHFNPIKTVFDFERIIVQKIFNNQLVQRRKDGSFALRYFDEIDNNPKYITANTHIQIMKYRKAFYDFIYKSKRQAITQSMFYDIMSNTILDDIKHDKDYDKTIMIKKKLNIWFSFYNYFNNVKNEVDMVNKTKLLFEKTKLIAQTDDEHISNDEEFAFAAGQLIRTILNKSESGERSHALLEPFLQKTDCEQFKLAIAREFDKYKHAFKFYKGDKNRYAFDKIMSEVMGVETEINMKKLLPHILAGYFSETIFKQDEENNSNNN